MQAVLDIVRDHACQVAGACQGAGQPGGSATTTALNQPHGVYVERNGDIIICDSLGLPDWLERVISKVS